ncbi:MAG: riboflavin synthase [Deltaproteobacteria bacterium]|nr:riboflavin synthase [Deltaproteobacteria bacterium]
MFTGIIEVIGKVVKAELGTDGGRLTIRLPFSAKKGESIAIDGACLTVAGIKGKEITFDVSDETVRKSTVGLFVKGRVVNVERALKASDRLGGHFVLGHVDGTGKIESVRKTKSSLEVEISHPEALTPYLIEKGSVAVDGVSLTASLTGPGKFKVYLIPETLKRSTLGGRRPGDVVNLEGDVLGKYVETLVSG